MDNRHTQDYLNYYLDLRTEPQYAIMLKGAWGSGKTWFLDKVLREYQAMHSGFKFLKVSLYGINTLEQIDDEFFRQLHPILSNKSLIFGANVLKNTLKATLKIDLNGDDKPDLDVSGSVPAISLKAFARDPDGFVLVFDDIERTGIDLGLLFGYINHFVEVNGFKAILIANEDEILRHETQEHAGRDATRMAYERKKEKLVGRTFEVASDIQGACRVFFGELKNRFITNMFKDNMVSVEAFYTTAGYNNLRHLRQFFLDVDRIVPLLGEKYVENTLFLSIFLHQLLIYSMEYRGGHLSNDEFETLGTDNFRVSFGGNSTRSRFDTLVAKYKTPILNETLLEGEHWRELIRDGKVSEALRRRLDMTRFFIDNNSPAWESLWSYQRLSESVLREKYDRVRQRLYVDNIDTLGEILMTASILVALADDKLTDDPLPDIVKVTCAQIDRHYNAMDPMTIHRAYVLSRHNELMAWHGMGFLSSESEAFKRIRAHVLTAREQRFNDSLPQLALQFSHEMQTGEPTFLSELYPSNRQMSLRLYNLPFLHLIDPGVFIDRYRQLEPGAMHNVSYALKVRYENGESSVALGPEYGWLVSLKTAAEKFIATSGSRFEHYHVNALSDHILTPAIAMFSVGPR